MHAARIVAESAGATHGGGIAPVGVGLLAFGILMLLLAVTWAFRNMSNRH